MQDLRYFVDAPSKAKSDNQSNGNPAKLELLKGITGYAAPGVLTALMGGSGTSSQFPVGACKLSKDNYGGLSVHGLCSGMYASCMLFSRGRAGSEEA